MQSSELVKLVETQLDENKGSRITTLDVRHKTSITDYMVIVQLHLLGMLNHFAITLSKNLNYKGFILWVWKDSWDRNGSCLIWVT